jgi:hypothetical protein
MGKGSPVLNYTRSHITLADIPNLDLSSNYLQDKRDICVIELLASFIIRDVKRFVNVSIVEWSNRNRPFVLRFDIPPMKQVLEMMASGSRVVTAFTEDVDREFKDNYPPYSSRDSLEFLIHDLQHMERFVDSEVYEEQVGFFVTLNTLHEKYGDFRNIPYFQEYDDQFFHDIDHVASDMNASSLFLWKFLKAKWIGAETRRLNGDLLTPETRLLLEEFERWKESRLFSFFKDLSIPIEVDDESFMPMYFKNAYKQ